MYVDTWHMEARRADGYVLTCYGLKSETDALRVAEGLRKMPEVLGVTLVHTTKATPRARWTRQKFEMKPL